MKESGKVRGLVALLAVLWVAIVVGAVVWGVTSVEDDIATRAETALGEAGFSSVVIDVSGRDVVVGEAQAGTEDAISAVLDEVSGVRTVEFDGDSVAAATTDTSTPAGTPATTAPPDVTTATTAPPTTDTTTPPPTTTTTTTTARGPQQAVVVATLEAGRFTLSGVVPDEATAVALLTGANIAYAPFVESDLVVDAGVVPVPWLAAAPTGISLLPMITEGTIRVEGDQIHLSGRSPNPRYLAAFEAAVGGVFGLPTDSSGVEITDLEPPFFRAFRSAGTLRLTGTLPSEETRQIIVGGARAVYGDEAVVDETQVADGLYVSFWMYTMPGVFDLFRPFPEYEIQVEDGVTSGALRGGASFEFGSADLTPELTQILTIGAAILSRDLSLGTAVEGHTDSVGGAAFNQELSERRAQAAVDFLVAAGIAPQRLQAVGFGEDRPAAPNDTAEGRTINRRVEFIFGPVAEVIAVP